MGAKAGDLQAGFEKLAIRSFLNGLERLNFYHDPSSHGPIPLGVRFRGTTPPLENIQS
jgi:hypothetical protein